ncbi:formylglycine-generating enzyme family protein [Streptosporangium sp. NPDC002607]
MTGPAAAEGMVWIPGGRTIVGCDTAYPEEAPAREALVAGFWMDPCPVTNRQFAEFVEATGHVTDAERPLDASVYRDLPPDLRAPSSLLFTPGDHPVDLHDASQWWQVVPGVTWYHPSGPGSDIAGVEDHPVVHVTIEDARAYARWRGAELAGEDEWEHAARGGLHQARYEWGDEFTPGGEHRANTWQGRFPWENLAADGWVGTSPVGSYPANRYGLHDMTGNVWEWTTSWWTATRRSAKAPSPCCGTPRVPDDAWDLAMPQAHIPRFVIKGGSHLCAPNYCRRYRPAARSPQAADTSSSHLGFRCILRTASPFMRTPPEDTHVKQ